MTPHDAMPDDGLDGHTFEELVDYLERGRTPYDASIERSPACRLALAGLRRVSELSASALQQQADQQPDRDEAWIGALLSAIRSEVRSGREVPIAHPDPALRLALTEAAVRGLIRAAGDALDDVLIGRSSLEGDIDVPGAPVRVVVHCSIRFGDPAEAVAARIREAIDATLAEHTDLVIESITVVVEDVLPPRRDRA